MIRRSKVLYVVMCAVFILSSPCMATNYNDGINADGPIKDVIKEEINSEFISQRAVAASRTRKLKILSTDENSAGIGNIIIGPGANLKGAIIINKSNNNGAAAIAK